MDEDLMSDADLWDAKVRSGMPKDQATAYVEARRGRTGGTGSVSVGPMRLETPADVQGRLERSRPVSAGESALAGAVEGGSFGFGDEMGGRIAQLFGGDYEASRDYLRARSQAAREQHPAANIAGAVGGGIASAVSSAGGSVYPKLAQLIGRVGAGAATGAGAAGLTGAGMADGTLPERLEGAAKAAPLGAGLGAGLSAAAPYAGRAASWFADIASLRTPASAAGVGGRGVTVNANPIPQAFGEVGRAVGDAAKAATRGIARGAGVRSAEEAATDDLLRALGRSGTTVDEIGGRLGAAGNKPVTLNELAGQPVQRLTRAVRTVPSRGSDVVSDALAERAAGTEERVLRDLLDSTGSKGRTKVKQTIEALAGERQAEAEKLYGAVYDSAVDRPELGRFFRLDAFKKAYDRARRIASAETVNKADDVALNRAMPALDEIVDEAGNLKRPLTVREIDRIKRGLDDVLDVGGRSPLDAGGLGNEEMATLRSAKNAFLAAVDEAVPGYADARSAFAGKSALMRALDDGRRYWKLPQDEAEALLAGMGEGEREMFRKGALEAVASRVEGKLPNSGAARQLDERTVDRQKLRLLFPDDASFERFRQAIAQETQMHATRGFVGGNSQTADKLAELADLAGGGVEALFAPGGTAPANLFAKLAQSSLASRLRGVTEQKADALAPMLTAGARDRGALENLIEALRVAEAERMARAGVSGRASSRTAGTVSGQRRR